MRRVAALSLLLLASACARTVPGTPAAAGHDYVIFFPQWSASLDTPALKAVARAADSARANPGVPILVSGYAANDNGSIQANKDLARTRAQVVVDALRRDGIDAGRIRGKSVGATGFQIDPVEARRVEISVGSR